MSTLAEIEAAVVKLPTVEQKALLEFIAGHVNRSDDPVAAVIGAYRSGTDSTGENAEDILYGQDGKW